MTDSRATAEALSHLPDIGATGELPLVSRKALIQDLAILLEDDLQANTFAATLGLTCARKTWPLWQSAFAAERRPMELAEAAVSNAPEVAREKQKYLEYLGQFKSQLDAKLLLGNEYFPAVYAGLAVWAVIRDVISQNRLQFSARESELQISPEDWEPCFFASLAVAGKATWEESSVSDVRRNFWEWYLTNAVPETFTKITAISSQ
jgi:Immunity protein Imm5